MDQVKIVGLNPPHAPVIYGTGRQNPGPPGAIPGPQVAHQQSARKYREHDKRPLDSGGGGQNYKNSAASVNAAQTVSPPMARTSTNNGGGGGGIPAPPSQPPAGVTPSGGGCYPSAVAYSPHPPPPAAGGDARYIPQTMIGTYRQDHYQRSNMDRPLLITQHTRRPTIMGHFGSYGSRPGEMMHIMANSGGGPVSSGCSAAPSSIISLSTKADNSKRIKLTPTPQMKQDMRKMANSGQVLHVDTDSQASRESSYYPQVEAISPTPMDTREDNSPDSTSQIVKQIELVDRDIMKLETSLSKMAKKAEELEAEAKLPVKEGGEDAEAKAAKEAEEAAEEAKNKNQSLPQLIYAANKKKAEEAHKKFFQVNAKIDGPAFLPLYHQPSDNLHYESNKRAFYSGLKSRLMERIKKDTVNKISRVEKCTNTYSKLRTEWLRKVEKLENCKKHKEKNAKNRELFEKVFSELRKQREDRERFTRVGARVKSDAEMEEIMDGLQEQENEEKKMRSYAVIPPIMLDEIRRSHRYDNKNGLIDDPLLEYKERKNINIWSEQEKDIFREKYLQHPKNFVLIASYLEKKTVSDCILHYYSTKKKENYKAQVKRRIRRPRNAKGVAPAGANAPHNNASVLDVVAMNSTGVTTRQSVAAMQQQKEQQQPPTSRTDDNNSNNSSNSNINNSNNISSSCPSPVILTTSNSTTSVPSSSPHNSETATTSATTTTTTINHFTTDTSHDHANSTGKPSSTLTANSVSSPGKDETRCDNNKEDPSKSNNNNNNNLKENSNNISNAVESSEDESVDSNETGGPHKCCACNTTVSDYSGSHRLLASQYSLYGLNHLPPLAPGAPQRRVCNVCRIRAAGGSDHHVQSKHNPQCPVGSCSTPKWKVRKLRSLPSRWHQLPPEVTDPIIREMQLPSGISRCCSRCLHRVNKLLGPCADIQVDPAMWSQHEVHALKEALAQFGRHWSRVCSRVPGKTDSQCKNFYLNFKNSPVHKLEDAVMQYKLSRGKSGASSGGAGTEADVYSSSDSSGSSTESCEEPPQHHLPKARSQQHRDSTSDTASASSPLPGRIDMDLTKDEVGSYDVGASGRESPEVQHIPHPGETHPHKPQQPSLPVHPGLHTRQEDSPKGYVRDIIAKCIESSLSDGASANAVASPDPSPYASSKVQPPPPSHARSDGSKVFGPETSAHQNYPWAAPGWPGPNPPSVISDPRSGMPRIHPPPPQEELGLDLSVKKRDRSSPAHPSQQAYSGGHHGVIPDAPHLQQTRDGHSVTVQGGAEIIITNKERRTPPPKAHSNSALYPKPPFAYENSDYKTKSPSPYTQDPRSLPPPPSIIAGNVQRVSSTSPHLIYPSQIRQQPSKQVSNKPNQQSQLPPPSGGSSARILHQPQPTPPPPQPQQHAPATVSRIPFKPEKNVGMHGSITHGTPINNIHSSNLNPSGSQTNRYETIPKPVGGREGSITQGTPVHHEVKRGGVPLKDGITYEPRPGVQIIPRSVPAPNATYDRESSYRMPRMSSANSSYYGGSSYYPRPLYSGSHVDSRQTIVANDFITSQEMARGRSGVSEKDIRSSPRPAAPGDPSPQSDHRDHRNVKNPAHVNQRVIDPRVDQHRVAVEHRSIDQRHIDHRGSSADLRQLDHRVMDPRDHRAVEQHRSGDHRMDHHRSDHPVVEIHANEVHSIPRSIAEGRSGNISYAAYPPHSQAYYINNSEVSSLGGRPSVSPASVRDATPTPPNNNDTSNHASPHEYLPHGHPNSHPPPPNRMRPVINRQNVSSHPPHQSSNKPLPPTSHYVGPPKSASPRTIDPADRYSPRHPENIHNLADFAAKRSQTSPATIEIRRDQRAPPPNPQQSGVLNSHEASLRSQQLQQQQHEHQQNNSRQYADNRLSINKLDHRDYERIKNSMSGHLKDKDDHDGPTNGKHHMVSYKKDDASSKEESLRVGNFINNIITRAINKTPDEGVNHQANPSRHNCQSDQKRYLPAYQPQQFKQMQQQMQLQKVMQHSENEVVMLEDGPPEPRTNSGPQHHKDNNPAMLHNLHPKSMQAHFESVINRELTVHDPKKDPTRNITSTRPQLEVIAPENNNTRSQIHHSQPVFDQWKNRANHQGPSPQHSNAVINSVKSHPLHPNDHVSISQATPYYPRHSTSHHSSQPPPNHRSSSSSPHPMAHIHNSSSHHPSSQSHPPHMTVDERQIIRIAQGSSAYHHGKSRTPPAASSSYTVVEQANSGGPNSSVFSLEYFKDKIEQAMRREGGDHPPPSKQDVERRAAAMEEAIRGTASHPPISVNSSRSGTPAQQHYEDEKRKMSENAAAIESSRPPSRPRSGPNAPPGGGKMDGRPDEVADSPQSGEMVIDENPRHSDHSNEVNDKHKQASNSSNNANSSHQYQQYQQQQQQQQYSNYSRHNRHGGSPAVSTSSHASVITSSSHPPPPHTTAWSTPNSTLSPAQQQQRSTPNYEPNVEPVSDDE